MLSDDEIVVPLRHEDVPDGISQPEPTTILAEGPCAPGRPDSEKKICLTEFETLATLYES